MHTKVRRDLLHVLKKECGFLESQMIIANVVSFIQCNIYEKKIETIKMNPIPKKPWDMLGTDIFQIKGYK